MNRFDGIIFDLDYTLYDEREYFFAVFQKFCTLFHYTERLESMRSSFITLRAVSKDIFTDVLQSTGFADDVSQLREELFYLYTTVNVRIPIYQDALSFLDDFGEKNLRAGVFTNGVIAAQQNKLLCLQISQYFDTIFFARQFGKEFEKPHTRSFEKVSHNIHITPTRLLFIGDNPSLDFQGAKMIGGSTVRLRRGIFKDIPRNEYIDYEIDSFKEISQIL